MAETDWPLLICFLGTFSMLKAGQPVTARGGGKTETLLCLLALRHGECVPREVLLDTLWPESDAMQAGQSLNSLVYTLNKSLGDAIDDPPVLHVDGCYRLNVEAGVGVDVACFDALAGAGDRHLRGGDRATAAPLYGRAIRLYRGDLCAGTDTHAATERERLRARYLTLLARLAEHHFAADDYEACLAHAQRMLAADPCREDAHRLVMRCHTRRGERAQALRQYRLCQDILRAEFDMLPEPETTALFDRVRLDPGNI
jgi:DNA-binding SARP family transcriptional activator